MLKSASSPAVLQNRAFFCLETEPTFLLETFFQFAIKLLRPMTKKADQKISYFVCTKNCQTNWLQMKNLKNNFSSVIILVLVGTFLPFMENSFSRKSASFKFVKLLFEIERLKILKRFT